MRFLLFFIVSGILIVAVHVNIFIFRSSQSKEGFFNNLAVRRMMTSQMIPKEILKMAKTDEKFAAFTINANDVINKIAKFCQKGL